MSDDMSIEGAGKMMAGGPAVSALADTRSALAERHAEHPQRAALAVHALNLVEEGLARLASLGHNFGLAEGADAKPEAFPTMVYQDGADMVVDDAAGLKDALANGWRKTPLAPPAAATKTGG